MSCASSIPACVDLSSSLPSIYLHSTIDSEGFKEGTRGAPMMPRDAVSRTANVGTVGKNVLMCDMHAMIN